MKRHILVEPMKTFCGQVYDPKKPAGSGANWNPMVSSPWNCDCRTCLTRYYFENPLVEGRIEKWAAARERWLREHRH